MWGGYHWLRTADTFLDVIGELFSLLPLGARHCHPLPNCESLIKIEYLVVENADISRELPSHYFTHVDQNAWHYIAGYMVQKLGNQLELSSHP